MLKITQNSLPGNFVDWADVSKIGPLLWVTYVSSLSASPTSGPIYGIRRYTLSPGEWKNAAVLREFEKILNDS